MIETDSKRALYINQAYETITGCTTRSFLENPSSLLEVIHPDDHAHAVSRFYEGAKTGYLDERFRIRRPNGETRWVWVRGFPDRDAEGNLVHVVGTALDITVQKQAEEQIAENLAAAKSAWAEEEALRKVYVRTQKVFASIRQVQSAFALRPQVVNSSRAARMAKDETWQIELRQIKFAYPRQENLLHIPGLRIGPGEQVAITGENGAGKSTLAKLMARIYDPLSGSIAIGGLDIREIDLKSLRDYVCYLPRDPVLFNGSVLSNLRFVRPGASQEEIETALAEMGLSTLIANLPHGLSERIGPGACQLSGGERQRLALARACLQDPRILILDEATSCLDADGEAAVLRNLRSRLQRTTFIVMSHRSSTLGMFPRILVVGEGRIQEDVRTHSLTAVSSIPGASIADISSPC